MMRVVAAAGMAVILNAHAALRVPAPTLAIGKVGEGTVVSAPAGINCGAICSAKFPLNTKITATAAPAPGAKFVGWSGDCSGASPIISGVLSGSAVCVATFAADVVSPPAPPPPAVPPAPVPPPPAGSADADFAARCAAPGVVLCRGLDSEAELLAAEMGKAGDGTRQGFIDTAGKASGAGSLKFTLRSGVGLQNLGGYWETPLGATFKVGDTIHVQYRFKASPEYFSNNQKYWRSSIKHINIHGPSSTCQGAEYTTVLEPGKQLDMYTNCGDGWFTDVTTNARLERCTADCLIQQGASSTSGYNCHYQNQFAGKGDGNGCFWPVADKWHTIYEKITVGQFGGSTSAVEAYVSVDGGPYKQFHRVAGVFFNNNRDNNFTHLRFETYMTEIRAAAPAAAAIWYDELIVSRLPIAAPGN